MSRILLLFVIAGLTISGCKNNINEINGKLLNSIKGEYILLDELQSEKLETVDSVQVAEDGTFRFTRKIDFPSFYLLKTDNSNFLTMLMSPGEKIEIISYRDSLSYPVELQGSRGTELMVSYNRKLRETISKLSALREIYLENLGKPELSIVMERLDSIAQLYLNELNRYTKKYIEENLTSLVSLVALYQQVAPGEYVLNPDKDLRYFVKVDSAMWHLYPDYEPVRSLHDQVSQMVSASAQQNDLSIIPLENDTAPEIALPDQKGDTIKLSSTRGSVVLLDIWASWCTPCRRENPNLVKAYNMYHSKGFEIYQVSLDKTRDAWIKGIEQDKIGSWIHVSDLKYWSSVVVPLFKLESIPANFLLDRDGKIIAANLRGDMLLNKLEELFNK